MYIGFDFAIMCNFFPLAQGIEVYNRPSEFANMQS